MKYRITHGDVAVGGFYVRLVEADYRATGGEIVWSGAKGPFDSESAARLWAETEVRDG